MQTDYDLEVHVSYAWLLSNLKKGSYLKKLAPEIFKKN